MGIQQHYTLMKIIQQTLRPGRICNVAGPFSSNPYFCVALDKWILIASFRFKGIFKRTVSVISNQFSKL